MPISMDKAADRYCPDPHELPQNDATLISLQAADLYGDLAASRKFRPKEYVPGIVVAMLASASAAYIAEHYHTPLTLMALLVGLSLNFLNGDKRLGPGLNAAAHIMLRMGIVLIGARITFAQVSALGFEAIASILLILGVTMSVALFVSARLGLGRAFGLTAGGAVAICGASAALAIAAVLGPRRINSAQLTLVLIGISAVSAFAMVIYPILCHMLGFGDAQAGYVLGASIHDVAQALGAGFSFSEAAGQNAAVVKLTRVALLAPLLIVIGLLFPGEAGGGKAKRGIPWFVAGFFAVATLNSMGLIPGSIGRAASASASAMLVIALTASAIQSPIAGLRSTGVGSLLVILCSSVSALLLACLFAALLV